MRTKEKILVIDTETANSLDDPLVYDIGYIIADRHNHIYARGKFVVYDIFVNCADLMKTAYYAEKIPEYQRDLQRNIYVMRRLLTIRREIAALIEKYKIKKVFAYNAYYDRKALNTTIRYITKSSIRYFLPYGVEYCDIMAFACDTICNTKKYKVFAENNNLISNRGRNYRVKAENVYQFISGNSDFIEEHKGLSDVLIEYEILLKCYATHKKVNTKIDRLCWQKVKREV